MLIVYYVGVSNAPEWIFGFIFVEFRRIRFNYSNRVRNIQRSMLRCISKQIDLHPIFIFFLLSCSLKPTQNTKFNLLLQWLHTILRNCVLHRDRSQAGTRLRNLPLKVVTLNVPLYSELHVSRWQRLLKRRNSLRLIRLGSTVLMSCDVIV
jgi:hypothetical protein